MTRPGIRPTASTITDDQVDALLNGLQKVYEEHYPHEPGDWCVECGRKTPCLTATTIQEAWAKLDPAVQLELPLEAP